MTVFGDDDDSYVGGSAEAVGGTSAASPSFAGVIALLNSESLESTGKPLGFLNPLLYKMAADQPSTFVDVTSGSNKCTEVCVNQVDIAARIMDVSCALGILLHDNFCGFCAYFG